VKLRVVDGVAVVDAGDRADGDGTCVAYSTTEKASGEASRVPRHVGYGGGATGLELYATDKRAVAHRCNDRLEDVLRSLFEGNPLLSMPPAWALFMKCMRSQEGEEPKDAFLYHTPKRLEEERKQAELEKGKRRWFSGG
jgi:hypothetical protein